MRVIVVGGGMAGLVLAQGLRLRGQEPVVLERSPAGTVVPGPIMLPFQAYAPLDDIGLMDAVRRAGRAIPPYQGDDPVAYGLGREFLLEHLRRDVDIRNGSTVTGLLKDGDRIVGCRVTTDDGETEISADLVVGADGTLSPVRSMAGFPAEIYEFDTATLSFRSEVEAAEPFSIHFLPDGRQVTMLAWSGGTAASWQIPRPAGGAEEAMAPGFAAYRRSMSILLPLTAEPLAAATEDDWSYRSGQGVRCDTWWLPGVALIGEALHAFNPEAGIGSGLGMGDAQALAVAIANNPEDADAACREWEHWRRPALAPYLAMGSQAVRVVRGGDPRPEEEWPPPDPFPSE